MVADADVVMKTYYDYKDVIDMKYDKKVYTGREKKSYGIAIKENKIFLTSPLKVYDKYDIIVNDDKLRIGRNLYLPASFITTYYKEYKIVSSVYTKEEVVELSKQRLERYLKELTNQGVTIIENKVTMKISGSTCTTSGKIIVEEEAIAFQKINDSEWRNIETDEHSGDDD